MSTYRKNGDQALAAPTSQDDRFGAILQELSRAGSVGVAELASRLDVSQATVRRDLAELEQSRLLTRTHGGAVRHSVTYELSLRYKSMERNEEKLRIAAEAARRVPDSGGAVGLTGGTTTTAVAHALIERASLTIVTNALNIASELAIRQNIKLVVTGGVLRSQTYELVGPLAAASLGALNMDLVFVGVDGVSIGAGLTTIDEAEADTNRVMLKRAQRVIVVADHTKIGHVAFARICELSAIDELITDTAADPQRLAELEDAGLKVTRV